MTHDENCICHLCLPGNPETGLTTKPPNPEAEQKWSLTRYVLGFMFRDNCTSVVLIRKTKPKWQVGLLNGIGGKIEDGESSVAAMVREFLEETGVTTSQMDWREFAEMSGDDFSVACFTARNSAAWEQAKTMEGEEVEKHHPDIISEHHCISNLHWLIELALDENEGRHHFANIRYSNPYRLNGVQLAQLTAENQALREKRQIMISQILDHQTELQALRKECEGLRESFEVRSREAMTLVDNTI